MNIYVGHLADSVTADSLNELFSEFGEVKSAKVIIDQYTNRPKGFGFIEMPSNSEADQAIKNLNGKRIEGSNIKVNPADPGGKRSKRKFRKRRY